jgi:hypothetical protein
MEKTSHPFAEDRIYSSGDSQDIENGEKPTVLTKENVGAPPPGGHNDLFHHYDPNLAPKYTKAEEDAVIRKLDWNLMPMILVLYSLSVLDRSNLGNARISGMEDDIDLSGKRYDWLGTTFYISCKYLSPTSNSSSNLYLVRHSLAMDSIGMESLQTPSLGHICSLWLGLSLDPPSGL